MKKLKRALSSALAFIMAATVVACINVTGVFAAEPTTYSWFAGTTAPTEGDIPEALGLVCDYSKTVTIDSSNLVAYIVNGETKSLGGFVGIDIQSQSSSIDDSAVSTPLEGGNSIVIKPQYAGTVKLYIAGDRYSGPRVYVFDDITADGTTVVSYTKSTRFLEGKTVFASNVAPRGTEYNEPIEFEAAAGESYMIYSSSEAGLFGMELITSDETTGIIKSDTTDNTVGLYKAGGGIYYSVSVIKADDVPKYETVDQYLDNAPLGTSENATASNIVYDGVEIGANVYKATDFGGAEGDHVYAVKIVDVPTEDTVDVTVAQAETRLKSIKTVLLPEITETTEGTENTNSAENAEGGM